MLTSALVAAAAAVGTLIGAVGIGGVVLAPLLTLSGAMDAHQAAATSTWCFMFTGLAGTYGHLGGRRDLWPLLRRLGLGLIPGAAAGALVNGLLSARMVLIALAAGTLFATASMFLRRGGPAPRRGRECLGVPAAVVTGALAGFGSTLTGTGGPVLLIPALLALRIRPPAAVAVSQAAQLAITATGSAGYLATTHFDRVFASALGVVAAVGALGGAAVARRLNARRLHYLIALALAGTTALLSIRIAGLAG